MAEKTRVLVLTRRVLPASGKNFLRKAVWSLAVVEVVFSLCAVAGMGPSLGFPASFTLSSLTFGTFTNITYLGKAGEQGSWARARAPAVQRHLWNQAALVGTISAGLSYTG